MSTVCVTVDLEPDCPPFLEGWRGVEEGMPRLLDLLEREGAPATFFTTGAVAERYPDTVRDVLRHGHELGGHGHSHRPFPQLHPEEARREIARSTRALRELGPVVSFRAPYLRFPHAYLPLLEEHGYRLDSSQARYKPWLFRPGAATSLLRVPASVTSSALRLPSRLRDPYLRSRPSPLVLFLHPWELVDLSAERIPWHCRFRTGEPAARCLAEVLRLLRGSGARFLRMRELLDPREEAAA